MAKRQVEMFVCDRCEKDMPLSKPVYQVKITVVPVTEAARAEEIGVDFDGQVCKSCAKNIVHTTELRISQKPKRSTKDENETKS